MSNNFLKQDFPKRPESVLVVVYTVSNRILLLRRKDDPSFWQSVTGSMLADELNPIEAARRELFEETALSEQDGKLIDCHCQWKFEIYPMWRHRYQADITHNVEHVFCFEMATSRAVRLSDEHTEYVWLPSEQALNKMKSETNQEAIIRFLLDRHRG